MTVAEIMWIVAGVGAVLALVALILLFLLNRRLKRLLQNQKAILGSRADTDIVSHTVNLESKVNNLRTAVEDLAVSSRDHEARIDHCLSRVGMVRFDAYEDLGGRQSTAVAFVDAKDNGMVITTVVSREFARMYVKALKEGQPDVPLAPEEVEALDQARTMAPFTVKPRLEAKKEDEAPAEPEPDAKELEAREKALERENRRRKRQGLPPLDELPPVPSTLGWPKLEPLEPLDLPESSEVTGELDWSGNGKRGPEAANEHPAPDGGSSERDAGRLRSPEERDA